MKKVCDRSELRKICQRLRGQGRRIVFTNGCFDILHAGHVRYLERARKLGDILVVGLNSDRSVAALKPGRPINSEGSRAAVLAGLQAVDYITVFNEKTPYKLIKSLRPDVLVKGGDWKRDEIVGSDLVEETLSLPFVKGFSTTGIIRKILRHNC